MNVNPRTAPLTGRAHGQPAAPSAPRTRERSLAWAAYAAGAWALAYAVGVRGYQGLGGTLGLAGTFDDPDAMRRASLLAGAGILLVPAPYAAAPSARPPTLLLPGDP